MRVILLIVTISNCIFAQPSDTLWTKRIGRAGTKIFSIIPDVKNGYVAVGLYNSANAWFLKFDENGDTILTNTYKLDYGKPARAITSCADSGYIIVGEWVLVVDQNGDSLNLTEFEYDTYTFLSDIVAMPQGGYMAVGGTSPTRDGYSSVCLLKLDESGNSVWMKTYSIGDFDAGLGLAVTADSGLIISGSSDGRTWMLRTDSVGDTVWTRLISSGWVGYDVVETEANDYIIAGFSKRPDVVPYILALDANGDSLWSLYGMHQSIAEVSYMAIAPIGDGTYILGGNTEASGRDNDIYLTRISSGGDTICNRIYATEGQDSCLGLCVTWDGKLLICGQLDSEGAILKFNPGENWSNSILPSGYRFDVQKNYSRDDMREYYINGYESSAKDDSKTIRIRMNRDRVPEIINNAVE